METKHRPNIFAITFIAALAGAVAGILTAPRSGRETREQLKTSADKCKNKTEGQVGELRKKADSKTREVKEKLADKAQDLSTTISDKADKVKQESAADKAGRNKEV